MDKRSWPWKKKSSDKLAAEKANVSALDSSTTASDVNSTQKPKYVQVSVESYTHLSGLEDQVKACEDQVQSLEDEVKKLNEKLSEAHLEMINKENLVKQHAKVAEEAVSGWEKAETEAATLKNHLESVTLLKLTAEDRASHLDDALKECMRQIRNLKDEHELKLQEVILSKTKIFDKMKFELETQIKNLEQQILRAAGENAALSRSLQERSNMLVKIGEEKSQAEAEIERLKSNVESCEKEMNSLRYECQIARKEAEIRNEEKNMSLRSAEAANKQHLDGVKKIAKLEAECQRLRGLVRKKLPGPAALAQMKIEVDNMGRDYGESRVRRSSSTRSPTAHFSQMPEFALDNLLKCQKENELLTERLMVMDEEARMLKEALSKRNSELQSCRSIYAETASKLHNLESQLQANSESRSHATDDRVLLEGFSIQKTSSPPSFTSVSECGNDDTPRKSENNNHIHLDLMDDFLEMEKLAYQSHESNETVSSSDVSGDGPEAHSSADVSGDGPEAHSSTDSPSKEDSDVADPQLQDDRIFFVKLKSEISRVMESMSKEKDMAQVILDVRHIMQDMLDTSRHQLENEVDDSQITNGITLFGDVDLSIDKAQVSRELETAISDIQSFVMILGQEDGLTESLNKFSAKYVEAKSGINLVDFVLDTSYVLREASKLQFNVLRLKSSEEETSSDCIDKIALPENKSVMESSGEVYQNGCSHFSDSDTPRAENLVSTSESAAGSLKCSLEEFEELKMNKDSLAVELGRCREKYESSKAQLLETEQLLTDVKSQLTSSQKFNTLAETQLKCMAESYNSLETRAEELQTQVNLLQGKVEHLDLELQEERKSHQESLNKCNGLLEQLERIETREAADNGGKSSQEKELSAAAEKLAECQETIFLLGKQLKAMHPNSKIEATIDEEPPTNGMIIHSYGMDTAGSFHLNRAGSESPSDIFYGQFSPSDSEANNQMRSPVRPKNRPANSSSSSASSTPTPEKQTRGFSRFFSSKGKTSN